MLNGQIWIFFVWALQHRPSFGIPRKYCTDFVCNTIVSSIHQPIKQHHYGAAPGLFRLLPAGPYGHENCSPISGHSLLLLNEALFTHGYCAGDIKRPFRDAVAAQTPKQALDLLRKSSGRINVDYPESVAQFNRDGCMDSMGYEILHMDPGRPRTCFSLIAVETAFNKTINLYRSGWLSLNSIQFEAFNGLAQFLKNGVENNVDVRHDLICIEVYRQHQGPMPNDYCHVLTYPHSYYRICCCYSTSKRLCHVHTNPLTIRRKPKIRCLVGKFASNEQLSIQNSTFEDMKSIRERAEYCTINYHLDLSGDKMIYKFEQKHGSGPPPATLKLTENQYYCEASINTQQRCPAEARAKLAPEYNITCYCQNHQCNQDYFSRIVESTYKQLCPGTETLIEMLKNRAQRCVYYVDLWNSKFYDIGLAKASLTSRKPETMQNETNNSVNIKLVELEIDHECLQPNLPTRGFFLFVCNYPMDPRCPKIGDLLEHAPDCFSVPPTKATGLSDVDSFINAGNKIKSNTTFRCFARAVIRKGADNRQTLTLEAGAVDNLPLEDMKNCISRTKRVNCAVFQHEDAQEKTILGCCYHSADPRLELRSSIQSAVLPKTPEDIRLFLANNTVCFRSWEANDFSDPKCLTQADGSSELDRQRFHFCSAQQNRHLCSKLTEASEQTSAFCCCGNSLTDCDVDQADWGQSLKKFLTG